MTDKREFFITHYSPDRASELIRLTDDYLKRYPKADLLNEGMLDSPAFVDGGNLICVLDNSGKIAGYIPLQPHLVTDSDVPHSFWTNMVILPEYVNDQQLRDLLLEQATSRAKEINASTPGHPARMWFQHHVSEVEAIEYVISKGAEYADSVLRMVRDLSDNIEKIKPPEGIEIKYWDVKTDSEVETYVVARNEGLGMPVTVEDWKHFLFSVVGNNGTTVAAFDGEKLVGSVSAYWIEDENHRLGNDAGWTENVFILSPWRGMGIADTMISMACIYLKENGMMQAQLDPGISNQRAVHVYMRNGYKITDESRQYWIEI